MARTAYISNYITLLTHQDFISYSTVIIYSKSK
jgi:hypothetical protein